MIIYVIIAMGQGDFLLFGMHIINILKVLEVVIFAPIVEEMYFRGVLQDCSDTLSPKTTKLTPFLSAGLFGLGHVRYSGTIVIFLVTGLGYVSSLLLKRYKSLYAPIFFHGIYNFTQVFIRIAKRG
jgi:membrane protease YdiL (CAAX protease family)